MATPHCTQETHHLKIDIDFDRILTITFPHTTWAGLYMDHLEHTVYHEDSQARMDDPYTVSMKLPKNVDRVHIGLSTSAAEGGAVALVLDSKRCARDWLASSPLWEQSRSSSPAGEMSTVLRTRWTHGEFEGRMANAASGGRNRPTWEAQAYPGPPPEMDRGVRRTAAGAANDVMGQTSHIGYPPPRLAQMKPFWKRG